MKRFGFIVVATIFLMSVITGCEDELIASANDRVIDNVVEVEDGMCMNDTTCNTDSIDNEWDKGTPIGFGVKVESYNEWDNIVI